MVEWLDGCSGMDGWFHGWIEELITRFYISAIIGF